MRPGNGTPKLDNPNYRLALRGERYHVVWWEDGRSHRVPTGQTDRRKAAIWLSQFVAGRGTPEAPEQPTVADVLSGYLADRKPVVRAYETLEVAAKALRRHLGDLQPDHLTKERIRFYGRQRKAEGHLVGPTGDKRRKPTSDGTIIRELVTLRAALKWAQHERWISVVPHIEVPSAPPARDRWLTREEADRLLAAAQALHVRVFIALGLHTAARSGALLELTWAQVDLTAGVIRLGDGVGNKRRGIVPINDALRPILETARQAATCQYVIEHGSKPVASVKTGFTAAAKRAGVSGISPHSLRHTAVTWMILAGVPMPMVARYAAMSLAMVETRYGHHSPDWLRQAAQALSG
jgi:integrase